MFKTETHLHAKDTSPCGHLFAEEMVKLYKEAGYSTVFVSDHFQRSVLEGFGDLSWNEKVDRFLLGYENAKKAGEALDLTVLPAIELRLDECINHYLVYGFDRQFLYDFDGRFDLTIEEFMPMAREKNLLVVQAHPYRDGKNLPRPELVDGFEVVNSNPRHNNFEDEMKVLAKNYGIYMTAGSDAHRYEDVAGAGMGSAEKIETAEDYIRLVRSGCGRLIKAEGV